MNHLSPSANYANKTKHTPVRRKPYAMALSTFYIYTFTRASVCFDILEAHLVELPPKLIAYESVIAPFPVLRLTKSVRTTSPKSDSTSAPLGPTKQKYMTRALMASSFYFARENLRYPLYRPFVSEALICDIAPVYWFHYSVSFLSIGTPRTACAF